MSSLIHSFSATLQEHIGTGNLDSHRRDFSYIDTSQAGCPINIWQLAVEL